MRCSHTSPARLPIWTNERTEQQLTEKSQAHLLADRGRQSPHYLESSEHRIQIHHTHAEAQSRTPKQYFQQRKRSRALRDAQAGEEQPALCVILRRHSARDPQKRAQVIRTSVRREYAHYLLLFPGEMT